jgi:hypothetical protein
MDRFKKGFYEILNSPARSRSERLEAVSALAILMQQGLQAAAAAASASAQSAPGAPGVLLPPSLPPSSTASAVQGSGGTGQQHQAVQGSPTQAQLVLPSEYQPDLDLMRDAFLTLA